MALNMVDNAEAGPSTGPYHMRIASGGSIANYVKFALDFLENNPTRPLILTTRPSRPGPTPSSASNKQPRSTMTLQPCTLSATRLITIAEVIKREYMALINDTGKGKGKHRAVGIWQYTKSGLVDPTELGFGMESGIEDGEGDNGLARILEGKIKPKMTHYPFLEITLSTTPLGKEKEADTCCQYLLTTRHRSRSVGKDKDGPVKEADKSGGGDNDQGVPVGTDGPEPDLGEKVARVMDTILEPGEGRGSDGKVDISGDKEKKRKIKSVGSSEGGKKKRAKA